MTNSGSHERETAGSQRGEPGRDGPSRPRGDDDSQLGLIEQFVNAQPAAPRTASGAPADPVYNGERRRVAIS